MHNAFLRTASFFCIVYQGPCQGCDLKNRLTIGKFSMIDTLNTVKKWMTKTCIFIYNEFSNIGPTRRTWLWRLKVKIYLHLSLILVNYILINPSQLIEPVCFSISSPHASSWLSVISSTGLGVP